MMLGLVLTTLAVWIVLPIIGYWPTREYGTVRWLRGER